MLNFSNKRFQRIVYLLPTLLLCCYFWNVAISFHLHDFGNSYFAAQLIQDKTPSELILFDIYDFNQYVWESGYDNELLDYYLNSPFTGTFFYPFTILGDALLAKTTFNGLSIALFLLAIYLLATRFLVKENCLLLFLPVLFFIPSRNNILFGQSYFLVFSLIIIGYELISKKRNFVGVGLLSLAVLLKFFPAFYGIPLLVKRKWKTILIGFLITLGLSVSSILLSGSSFWQSYFLDVL
ncbi:MAG: glycosyltransferase family 87 protein, partial [Flavobacteriaceae bacterium]